MHTLLHFEMRHPTNQMKRRRDVVTTQLPTLLDVNGIAEHLGVSAQYVRKLVAARRIPYIKWGHYVRFDPSEIAKWLTDATVQAVDPGRYR